MLPIILNIGKKWGNPNCVSWSENVSLRSRAQSSLIKFETGPVRYLIYLGRKRCYLVCLGVRQPMTTPGLVFKLAMSRRVESESSDYKASALA